MSSAHSILLKKISRRVLRELTLSMVSQLIPFISMVRLTAKQEFKAWVELFLQVEMSMKVSMLMTRGMALEGSFGLTVLITTVIGQME